MFFLLLLLLCSLAVHGFSVRSPPFFFHSHPAKEISQVGVSSSTAKSVLAMTGGSSPSKSNVNHINDLASFQSILAAGKKSNSLIVVDFSATWCRPCQMVAPLFDALSLQLANDDKNDKSKPSVVFVKVDVDEGEAIAAMYRVSSMPTFVFFQNNLEVSRFSGASIDKVKQTISQFVK